jgi:hypothetical protein
MNWLKENWDKILSAFISAGVGGVVGFFSAVSSLQKEINDLHRQLIITNAKLEQSIDPKIKSIDEVSNKMQNLEMRFIIIETQSTMLRTQSEILLKSQIIPK